jgi:hypothetical protein
VLHGEQIIYSGDQISQPIRTKRSVQLREHDGRSRRYEVQSRWIHRSGWYVSWRMESISREHSDFHTLSLSSMRESGPLRVAKANEIEYFVPEKPNGEATTCHSERSRSIPSSFIRNLK